VQTQRDTDRHHQRLQDTP
jgi:hypothetical protein